eukprot:comp12531_c0_seq1/m.7518 comp12531_c0_seq1/g.7518  ORF comp12531_c0_seq1/g.7518 comp12531_c0_seq1/m.7518 type:complete len:315 (-) comp12531_c0_seq1:915-1859(-)
MGQTLSEPITEKHTVFGENENLAYAASAMQGWRISMEDAHTAVLHMEGDEEASFFAVYDGHGGTNVALYAGENLHKRVVSDPAYKAGDYAAALKNGFLGTDDDMRKEPSLQNDRSGATAVAALLKNGKLYVANAGDSRAVLSRKKTAYPMSQDHKPTNEQELRRIIAANGFVEFGRVNGNLALSRAVGDFEFKANATLPPEDQIVTANPDITDNNITPDTEFAVLACDGIWDVMSNQSVVDFVHDHLAEGMSLPKVCEELMNTCLAPESKIGGVGCDNMTVVIVVFKKNYMPNPNLIPKETNDGPSSQKDGELC